MKISGARSEPFADIRRRSLAEAGAKAVSGAPAVDQARFLGVDEAELTPAVRGAIAALVIELEDLKAEVRRLKARLQEAEAQADEDPLTGVKNRRAFVRELTRIAAFALRYQLPVSLIYFDVDALKAVNDRFGHAAGDAALKSVAAVLSGQVRESDVVGRLGGDEFAVALAQADLVTAVAKAQALAAAIEAVPAQSGEWLAPVKVSWGVHQLDPMRDVESEIAAADAAMFAMKRSRSDSQ